jgi:hypothetical protein
MLGGGSPRKGKVLLRDDWREKGLLQTFGPQFIEAPFIALDFERKPDWKPRDQADLDQHIADSLSIVRWLKEDHWWKLAVIDHTGSKPIHAWFAHRGDILVETTRQSLNTLGIDKSLIVHPEHPARLPGQVHAKRGKTGRILWLRWFGPVTIADIVWPTATADRFLKAPPLRFELTEEQAAEKFVKVGGSLTAEMLPVIYNRANQKDCATHDVKRLRYFKAVPDFWFLPHEIEAPHHDAEPDK